MEEEAGALLRKASSAEAKAQGLEKDNLMLFERIRYLQRYQTKQHANAAYKIVNVDEAGVPQPAVSSSYCNDCTFLCRGFLVGLIKALF